MAPKGAKRCLYLGYQGKGGSVFAFSGVMVDIFSTSGSDIVSGLPTIHPESEIMDGQPARNSEGNGRCCCCILRRMTLLIPKLPRTVKPLATSTKLSKRAEIPLGSFPAREGGAAYLVGGRAGVRSTRRHCIEWRMVNSHHTDFATMIGTRHIQREPAHGRTVLQEERFKSSCLRPAQRAASTEGATGRNDCGRLKGLYILFQPRER